MGKIRKNVKLFTKRFTKRKENARLPTLKNAVMIIMAPAMEEVNVIIMVILATMKNKSNAKKCPMKVAITLRFQEMYLTPNATMSKFPSIPKCQNKNATMLRCPSIPKYLNKVATMLRYPNATKFQRKSATPAHTYPERHMAAATAATIAAMGVFTVVRPKSI